MVVLAVITTGFFASVIVTVYCQCFPQALGFNDIGQPQEDSEPADIKGDQEMVAMTTNETTLRSEIRNQV